MAMAMAADGDGDDDDDDVVDDDDDAVDVYSRCVCVLGVDERRRLSFAEWQAPSRFGRPPPMASPSAFGLSFGRRLVTCLSGAAAIGDATVGCGVSDP
jgi:hypothetical protein